MLVSNLRDEGVKRLCALCSPNDFENGEEDMIPGFGGRGENVEDSA